MTKTFTVTSIQKCYEQLSREDALDIQKNYIKPYQECQRRLTLKLKNRPSPKEDAGKSQKQPVFEKKTTPLLNRDG